MAAVSSHKKGQEMLMKRKSTGAMHEGNSSISPSLHRGNSGKAKLPQQQENDEKSLRNQVEQLKFALKSAHDEIDELTNVVHLLHNENEALVSEIDVLSKHHKLLQVKCFEKMQREEKFCQEYNSLVKYSSRRRLSPRKPKTSAVLAALQGLAGNHASAGKAGHRPERRRSSHAAEQDETSRKVHPESSKRRNSSSKGSIRKTWHGSHKEMIRVKNRLQEAEELAKSEHALSISARTEEETVMQDEADLGHVAEVIADVDRLEGEEGAGAEDDEEGEEQTLESTSCRHSTSTSSNKKSDEDRVRTQRRKKRAQRHLNRTWHGNSCCGSVKSTSSTATTELLRLGAGSTRRLMHGDDADSIGSMSEDDTYEGFAYRH